MFVLIDSINKVKNFVNIASKIEGDIFLKSGRYLIDGKSIMGIFSLDLAYPIEMIFEGLDDTQYEDAVAKLKEFIL